MTPATPSLLRMVLVWVVASVALMSQPIAGNQQDPHLYPPYGPFFEGWYLRIIDSQRNASFGFLFGLVLPATAGNMSAYMKSKVPETLEDLPLLCASLLLNPSEAKKLASPTGCFDPKDYSVLKEGRPVEHDPDDKTPPSFEVKLATNISYSVTPTGTSFSIKIGDHSLEGETTSPVPWGPDGEGPESWLEHLPLPIHWFVYSFRSEVTAYRYINDATDVVISGGSSGSQLVVAHMEKNWGQSFIEAWVWAEGVNPATDVYFAFSSGLIKELGFEIPAQLAGYRNPSKGFDCSFHPANSEHMLTYDGCAGTATLDVRSIECHVIINLQASPQSFSSCLVTPQAGGFTPGCVESYTAVANITAVKALSGMKDQQVVRLAALEFGGLFMCNSTCPEV